MLISTESLLDIGCLIWRVIGKVNPPRDDPYLRKVPQGPETGQCNPGAGGGLHIVDFHIGVGVEKQLPKIHQG